MSALIWRRGLAAAIGAALFGGLAAPGVLAQPAPPTQPAQPGPATQAAAPSDPAAKPRTSPDQVLMTISQQYQSGSGGGQVSKLIEQVMRLRTQGYRPSRANSDALVEALDKRPNQAPLVSALQATLATQKKLQLRAGNQVKQPAVAPPATPGIVQAPMGPGGWAPGNPMGPDTSAIFPIPGRANW